MAEKKTKTPYFKSQRYGQVYGPFTATPFGRAAWVHLVKPKEVDPIDGKERKPQYQLTLLLNKADEDVKKFMVSFGTTLQEMVTIFNEGRAAKISVASPFKDGDEFDIEKYPYYKGCWVVPTKLDETTYDGKPQRPEVIDGKKRPIAENMVEGGNIVRIVVKPLVTAQGPSYHLQTVQFVKDDGVKFANAIAAPDTYLSVIEDTPEPTEEAAKVEEGAKPAAAKSNKEMALEVL